MVERGSLWDGGRDACGRGTWGGMMMMVCRLRRRRSSEVLREGLGGDIWRMRVAVFEGNVSDGEWLG